MTTPAPERPAGRRRSSRRASASRPVLRLSWTAWLLAWLAPTLLMGTLLLGAGLLPQWLDLDWDMEFIAPLIPYIGAAAAVVGIPGTLLVGWLLRHELNPLVHVLGWVVVGLLYGPVILAAGAGGLVPMLIPIIGFPAGVLMGISRWLAQTMAYVTVPDDASDSL
ncbi:hypothetical protein [Nesterenkonia sp. NBAIMH1]|uniref:hypothetical protein n=1 Tax=Nesterenkonia sp. NBAIMH1 TaxID=2600320 RepID=UPI0011B840D6|nr:hypothetical protein [Nesterenkonia sp. NBAIMH1]